MDLEALHAKARTAAMYLQTVKGYDSAKFTYIMSMEREEGAALSIYFALYDDFQYEVPEQYRQKHGYSIELSLEELNHIENWPNREQRELCVLAARLAGVSAASDKLMSAAAQSFVAGLLPTIETIRNQIGVQK
jgi:hypothetical protein